MAKYAMIGKAEAVPQISRSTVCDARDCLQDDLVTSQVVLDECTTYVGACRLRAAGRLLDRRYTENDQKWVQIGTAKRNRQGFPNLTFENWPSNLQRIQIHPLNVRQKA